MNIISIIPQIIFFVCLGVMIVIVIRRFPRTKNAKIEQQSTKNNKEQKRTVLGTWKEKFTILKKRSSGWLQTFTKKKEQAKNDVDMKAESNIQSLQQSLNKQKNSQKQQARPKRRTAKELFSKQLLKRHSESTPKSEQEPVPITSKQEIMPKPEQAIAPPQRQEVSLRKKIAPAATTPTNPGRLLDEEKRYLQRIVENPKDIQSYKTLAEIYIQQKNIQDAIHSLEEVLKLNPNDLISEEKIEELRKYQEEQASLAQR